MAIEDRWHFADQSAAARAGVTERCKCGGRKALYPSADHERGKRWRVRDRINGKQVAASFGLKTQAEDYELTLKARKRSGGPVVDRDAGKELFRDYGAEVIRLRDYTPSSRSTNRGYLKNHLNPYLGDIPLGKINHTTVEGWKAWMRGRTCKRTGRPYSAGMIELVYILLSTVLKSALYDGKIVGNPCKNIEYPKPPPAPEIVVWQETTVDGLLASVPDPHHALLLLAAHCGHRQGEAFAVSLEDMQGDEIDISHQVQRVDGKLVLVPCKHNSMRKAPLPDDVTAAMRLHVQRYSTITLECVCPRRDHYGKTWRILFHDQLPDYVTGPRARAYGRPLVPADWNERIWHPALLANDIDPKGGDKTGMHMLRHYCASTWIDGGATMLEVSRWLGHKSITVTQTVYGHLFDRSAQRGRQIMANAFAARRTRALELVKDHG